MVILDNMLLSGTKNSYKMSYQWLANTNSLESNYIKVRADYRTDLNEPVDHVKH